MKRFIAVWILALIVLLMVPYRRREGFATGGGGVRFLSKDEVGAFIMSDKDQYLARLTKVDLSARKASSVEEYKKRSAAAAMDVPKDTQEAIKKHAAMIDKYLLQTGQHKLVGVPWVIAVTEGNAYENGYPHTRSNVIFLSSNDLKSIDLARTLLHEKVHVYQRMYPEDMREVMKKGGYKPWKLRRDVPLARANPDLDEWIYTDPVSDKPMVAYYTSATPSSISDVTLEHPSFEHPYEKMAYDIANAYV